ncbi:MAG: glycosyltransferase [Candidatus Bathyarchaeia archaeon]
MKMCYVSTFEVERSIRGLKISKALSCDLMGCPSKIQRYTLYPLKVFLKLLKGNYGLVIVNNIPVHLIIPCLLASKIRRFKVLVDFVNLWSVAVKSKYPLLWRLAHILEAVLYRGVSYGIAINEALSGAVLTLGVDKVTVIYDAAEEDVFTPGYSDVPRIIAVANLRWDEGLDLLLLALRKLKDRGLSFQCVIIGDGEEKHRLKRMRDDLGLFEVKFLGWVPYGEVPRHMRMCSVGVAPVRAVSPYMLPIKIFEMLSSGLAVVASDIVNIRAIVEHGKNGLLFQPGNHEALAAQLEKLLVDKVLLRRLQHNARETVESRFSWRYQAEKLKRYVMEAVIGKAEAG